MISFIIIGRNEGWKLSKCIESVFKTIAQNKLSEYEIIYVDSNSTDDSISRAKSFPEIIIFKITGEYNSAIARNIGAKESNGDVLFFVDGDMEIVPDFLSLVYDKNDGLIYEFISGQYVNRYYDKSGNIISEVEYDASLREGDQYQPITGGLFIIKKQVWININGMKTKYRRSQDLDLGLRLAKKGILLLRKKELMAIHNTVDRRNSTKIWSRLLNGSYLYNKSLIYREHLFNKAVLPLLYRQDYSLIVLFVMTLLSSLFTWKLIIVYLVVIFARALMSRNKNIFVSAQLLIFHMVKDISVGIGFFIFFPKEIDEWEYQRIV